MSNFPPQPPRQPVHYPEASSVYGQQPGGYGPVFYIVPPKTSVTAILSLIFSLAVCIPLASVLAVLLGIIGLVNTSKPNVSGRPLAVAGLLIGSVVSLAWIVGGIYAVRRGVDAYQQSVVVGSSIQALAAGDLTAARSGFAPNITDEEISALATELRGLGKFRDIKDFNWNKDDKLDQDTQFNVVDDFTERQGVPIALVVGRDPNGKFQIKKIDIRNAMPNTNPPAPRPAQAR